MLWHYSRRDTKVLLVATLSTFSGYGLLLGHDWQQVLVPNAGFQGAQVVSVGAGVIENPVNSYMAQLERREQALAQREAALANTQGQEGHKNPTLLMVTLGGLALLALILLNFYLDSRRRLSFG